MTMELKPQLWWGLLIVLACLLSACSESMEPGSGGSETNWLTRCTSQSDCNKEASCECGICTQLCESAEDCSDVPGAATCLVAEPLDNGSCRVILSTASSQGVCVARCQTDSDCNGGSGFDCVKGVCVAIIEETPLSDGGIEVSHGLVFPEDNPGTEAIEGGLSTDTVSRDANDNSSDTPLDSSVETDSSISSLTEDNIVQEITGINGPYGFPQCPCSVDVEMGTRAPKFEDVPRNPYGRPEFTTIYGDPCNGYGFRSFMGRFFDYELARGYTDESVYQGLEELCLSFNFCYIDCDNDDTCPNVDSGSAVPRCSASGVCILYCDSERSCPDGMMCVSGIDGSVCLWPEDRIEPGCPAFCEQNPLPRECSNFCAALLMACDPDKEIYCCEGLSCSTEGYCVQE
jgi:hypothetical protein